MNAQCKFFIIIVIILTFSTLTMNISWNSSKGKKLTAKIVSDVERIIVEMTCTKLQIGQSYLMRKMRVDLATYYIQPYYSRDTNLWGTLQLLLLGLGSRSSLYVVTITVWRWLTNIQLLIFSFLLSKYLNIPDSQS